MKKPHHISESGYMNPKPDGSFEIKPKGLNIVWGDDPRYWNLSDNGVATLIQVSWLDVSGSVEVTGGKKYRVSFEVSLKPDAFGWNGSQVLVMGKVGKKGQYNYKAVNLVQSNDTSMRIPNRQDALEIEVPEDANEKKLYFGLYEVWSGKWKGGLQINSAFVERVP